MKFKIKQAVQQEPEEKTVEASLEVDKEGDLILRINGIALIHINKEGFMSRPWVCNDDLSNLGFLSNMFGQICTAQEKEKGSYK